MRAIHAMKHTIENLRKGMKGSKNKGNNGVIQTTPNFNHAWNAMFLSQISTLRCHFIVVARM